MTSPAPLPGNEPPNVKRANWLGRYLEVEGKFDKKLKPVLEDALSDIDNAFEGLGDGFSQRVRKQQLALSHKAVRKTMHGIFGDAGNLIRDGRQDAAVAAIDAQLYDQKGILSSLFPDPIYRKQYADSLKLTASRNIDAVVTRVLETEKPLSRRVYRAEALANKSVSKIINRGLAKGDSAANIARDVRDLIDPNTPGGVSYAAKRLGRTEINNAFHAQAIHDSQNTPWIQTMRWNLSKVHEPDNCLCETYYQIGLFDVEKVPGKPHPNCRCFVTPELPAYEDFETSLVSGQYDSYLDSVLGFEDTGLEPVANQQLSPEKQAKLDAILKRAEQQVAADEAAEAAEKARVERLFQEERARQVAEKAAREAQNRAREAQNRARAEAAEKARTEKERLRNVIDTDTTVPASIAEAISPKQVSNYLTDRFDGLIVEGFETGDIAPEFAKQVATGLVEQIEKHPRTNLRAIRVVDFLPDIVPAETRFNLDGKEASDILFNREFAGNYEMVTKEAALSQIKDPGFKNGHLSNARKGKDPWWTTTIHEFGHVLSNSGGRSIERGLKPTSEQKKLGIGIGNELIDDWMRSKGLDPYEDSLEDDWREEYESWIVTAIRKISGYSFDDKKRTRIHAAETIAEAYLETEINPEVESLPKLLREKMLRAISRNESLKVRIKDANN